MANNTNISGEGADHRLSFKVVLLGEGAVGKTSLVLRYVENKFNDKHLSTLQASYLTKKLNISDKRITLALWDTAGQERFHALGPIYYRDSNGALLVYDITDEDSFKKVQTWVKELRKMLGSDICLRIVGNKIDLDKERHVSLEEAENYSASVGAKHFQTSAKLNKGLDELFYDLSRAMIQNHEEEMKLKAASNSTTTSRNTVTILPEDPQQNNSLNSGSGCC